MTLNEMTTGMRDGDEAAYGMFHREYQHRLYQYVFVLVRGNEADALDVSQETLLRVIRHIRPFDDPSIFWDWMTCLARSASIDQTRRTVRWWRRISETWSEPIVIADETDRDIAPLVQRAIDGLSAGDQKLLRAKYAGRSVRELAREFEQTEGAIESRLVRIRAKIREQVLLWRRHDTE